MGDIINLTERVKDRAAVRVLETAKAREKLTVAVIEGQTEVYAAAVVLRAERTVQRNPTLRRAVDAIIDSVKSANIATCQLWFADEVAETEPLEAA